ncbi:uncharacterized protein F4822DRAFT_389540 [Hypoxylon trugodes]|uniref:uncharacterized protein n=1 Tax=Hypoxylon trugodes TaxID=326681 RepID=UPI00219FC405|nr:uncharacterized protein F4822DRAFT_389540 [Hypoxylon trugodes]KAI1392065.1 hypothetical protein F4822DRAFT_389540 [Hypoxylon trugodes]
MPALTPALLLSTLAERNLSIDSTVTSNGTGVENAIQVVCAWPVSGQYGPGSRYLYYCLVAACVFARKAEWLRNACLAAALVFPAVAALHGIVLTAVHVDNAIDMDVYGAFQFCSIGILAAPLTVRISRTYFYDPGRNIIFVWTGLVLAGLVSLTVEFFRVAPSACPNGNNGNSVNPNDINTYGNFNCSITCDVDQGPYSPLRQDSTNEIFIIPAPSALAFNAATLLAAACCIPAVLSLASTWNKILEINWKTRFGLGDENQPIEGTNGATAAGMSKVNTMVRLFLSTVEVPLFSAAVLTIIVIGEKNFWSSQVRYQTEPMTSIVVGTGLAALGSLYVLLAVDLKAAEEEASEKASIHHCTCAHHHHFESARHSPRGSTDTESAHEGDYEHVERVTSNFPVIHGVDDGFFAGSSHSIAAPDAAHVRPGSLSSGRGSPPEVVPTTGRTPDSDIGGRRKVAKALMVVSDYLGTASRDRFDDSDFKHGKALDFPEVPAEEMRNPDLPRVREAYNNHHSDDENHFGTSTRPSRAGSYAGSVASMEGSPMISRAFSVPHPPSRSPSPSSSIFGVRHASTLPVEQKPSNVQDPSTESNRGRPPRRRDTLEVPGSGHHNSPRHTPSTSTAMPVTTTITNDQGSPAIVISPDPDISPPAEEVTPLGPSVTHSSSEPAPSSQTKLPPPSA